MLVSILIAAFAMGLQAPAAPDTVHRSVYLQARPQLPSDTAAYSAAQCPPTPCAAWNAPTEPKKLFGNTYYVGTRGLSALLITSPTGHVLIDGGLPNSAMHIIRSIRSLGFREQDIKLILNSHVHYDHAGGLAALQRLTGAAVAASPGSAPVLRTGKPGADDPQHAIALPTVPVANVRVFRDGETVRGGDVSLVAHVTPGHTPGGTSWTWRSCEGDTCLDFVYADSMTPVSADDFYFTRSTTYPNAIQDFERSFATLEKLPCDVLVTPHPGASMLWQRLDGADGMRLVNRDACRRYANTARQALARRIATEKGGN